jgi:phospholipid/cholesterol/gamma-HCH transport system permease protein
MLFCNALLCRLGGHAGVGPRSAAGYDRPVSSIIELHQHVTKVSSAPLRWLIGWWRILFFGASLLVLAGARSSYSQQTRQAALRHIYLDTAPILWWFTVLSALLTLVITRIVVVTALSYGLSQYALEMVIRVLVLELIPLTAALFVALRCTIPNGALLADLRRSGHFERTLHEGQDPILIEVMPRVLAGIFAGATLAALSSVVALVIAYFGVYGFTTAGLPTYIHVFGHVFNPSVSLIFALKTLFFSLAVSIIPMASGLYDIEGGGSRESAALLGLVRMFAALLVIEIASLAGNYY